MASANDLEKESGHEDTNQLEELRRADTESTFEEALDAQANIEPPVPGDAPIGLTKEKSLDPGPPPNGGFAAWLQVAGSFFLFFNSWYVARYIIHKIEGESNHCRYKSCRSHPFLCQHKIHDERFVAFADEKIDAIGVLLTRSAYIRPSTNSTYFQMSPHPTSHGSGVSKHSSYSWLECSRGLSTTQDTSDLSSALVLS